MLYESSGYLPAIVTMNNAVINSETLATAGRVPGRGRGRALSARGRKSGVSKVSLLLQYLTLQ